MRSIRKPSVDRDSRVQGVELSRPPNLTSNILEATVRSEDQEMAHERLGTISFDAAAEEDGDCSKDDPSGHEGPPSEGRRIRRLASARRDRPKTQRDHHRDAGHLEGEVHLVVQNHRADRPGRDRDLNLIGAGRAEEITSEPNHDRQSAGDPPLDDPLKDEVLRVGES